MNPHVTIPGFCVICVDSSFVFQTQMNFFVGMFRAKFFCTCHLHRHSNRNRVYKCHYQLHVMRNCRKGKAAKLQLRLCMCTAEHWPFESWIFMWIWIWHRLPHCSLLSACIICVWLIFGLILTRVDKRMGSESCLWCRQRHLLFISAKFIHGLMKIACLIYSLNGRNTMKRISRQERANGWFRFLFKWIILFRRRTEKNDKKLNLNVDFNEILQKKNHLISAVVCYSTNMFIRLQKTHT